MTIRRTPLRRVSKKHAAALAKYYELRRAFLSEQTLCEGFKVGLAGCEGDAVEVHHQKGRGIHLNDVSTFLAVCRPCHEFIHQHPSQARARGWLSK